ncbi:alpha/beta-hydrolase family protein [Tropicimonas sp. IMCC34043]|uniref:alpha/beta hydrolase n=1 Tax=Tropicimonas sp. IMCC34043 TaxID=2248760 RepID=UPI000E286F6B|nr:alpha/beta-hydrolase family protein [Tropicimonas sp. IMCC34043]
MADSARFGIWRYFSGLGLLIGAAFFAASLTPSLIPRPYLLQGVLGGVAFALGYGIGVLLLWLWEYLGLPMARHRLRQQATWVAAAAAGLLVLVFLWKAAGWQNSIRELMQMPPLETGDPLKVAAIAVLVAILLILIGRLFLVLAQMFYWWLDRFVPPRIAGFVGAVLAFVVFAGVIDGVLLRGLLRSADASFEALDALIDPTIPRPEDPDIAGSTASLLDWDDLGKAGRAFVTGGPTQAEIADFTGAEAMEPIRIYVGLNSADGFEAQAELALEEMKRVGAFERSVLVVAVPTGTGWMDPAAMDTLEYLHRGDVATVAIQYSYLTSYISLLVEPDYSLDAGRELFRTVYNYWRTLPKDARPRFYLYGISLGAYSSQQSVQLHEVIGDPIDGALWVGPPFVSPVWRSLTDERNPGTPEWRPKFENGAFVRFTNAGSAADLDQGAWGPLRIVYLQHASDPIVFFEPTAFYRAPAWMAKPRGPDVSADLRWYPGVSFLQLLLDMAVGLKVPMGHGHLYSYSDHIRPWIEVTQPTGWSEADIARLEGVFAQ